MVKIVQFSNVFTKELFYSLFSKGKSLVHPLQKTLKLAASVHHSPQGYFPVLPFIIWETHYLSTETKSEGLFLCRVIIFSFYRQYLLLQAKILNYLLFKNLKRAVWELPNQSDAFDLEKKNLQQDFLDFNLSKCSFPTQLTSESHFLWLPEQEAFFPLLHFLKIKTFVLSLITFSHECFFDAFSFISHVIIMKKLFAQNVNKVQVWWNVGMNHSFFYEENEQQFWIF